MDNHKLTREELIILLAKAAKQLTYGMQDRVKRNPDIADYISCFNRVIKDYESAN